MLTERFYLEIEGWRIPVELYRERRRGMRIALGKSAVLYRLPQRLTRQQEREYYQRLVDWLHKIASQKPDFFQRYQQPDYVDGQELIVGKRSYRLRIEQADRKTNKAQLNNSVIHLVLSNALATHERQEVIRKLLHRAVAADQLPWIRERVLHLNAQHFQQPIREVRLRYNTSNWGSCSNRGSINLSTRLLCAPEWVIDYVIIHELAHRLEMNHSDRYWALVARALPNYAAAEAWLHKHEGTCHF